MAQRRRIAQLIACIACASVLASCAGEGGSAGIVASDSEDAGERVRVESVTDGDTIRVRSGRRVRLVQVDAPETGDRAQCWGTEASEALQERLRAGGDITLEVDPDLDDVDDHGRELRYVEHDGEVLNVWLVREGHALPYFFRGDRGIHANELIEAAREARSERRGMWGACRDVRLQPGIGI